VPSLHSLHQQAIAAIDQKKFALATKAARKAAKLAPEDAYTLNLLGVCLQSDGKTAEAERCFRKALACNASVYGPQYHLGCMEAARGNLREAKVLFAAATALQPDDFNAWQRLGAACRELEDHAEAVTAFHTCTQLRPKAWHAWINLALSQQSTQDLHAATASIDHARSHAPGSVEVLMAAATIAREQQDEDKALKLLAEVRQLDPTNAVALAELAILLAGSDATAAASTKAEALRMLKAQPHHLRQVARAFQRAKDYTTAADLFAYALFQSPDDALLRLSHALCLVDSGNELAAIPHLTKLTQTHPQLPEPYVNLGQLRKKEGKAAEAEQLFRNAWELDPDCGTAPWNLSLTLLGRGALAEGWDLYHYRWHTKVAKDGAYGRRFSIPHAFDAGGIEGKRLLIWREQGVGDEVMFASVINDAINAAQSVTFECSPRYTALFQRSFPQATVVPDPTLTPTQPQTDYSGFDCHCAIADLPRLFRRSAHNFPASPYIVADPQRAQHFNSWLQSIPGQLKVGISWRSGVYTPERARRHFYTRLDQWDPILQLQDLTFVNLLYGDCSEEIATTEERLSCRIHQPPDLDLRDDLDGLFALLSTLDVVISAQSSIIDSAGSLGITTLAWLPPNSIYRLTEQPGKCLWYPSVRIIDRGWYDPWEPTIQQTANILKQYIT
jgi:Flp pilus assembly protein TadD